MRFVSLVPEEVISVDFGSCHQQLSYLEESPNLSLEAGVYPLRVSSGGQRLLEKRLGLSASEKALIVILGNRGVSRPDGILDPLKVRFEGQGHAFRQNYAVQARILRGNAYLDPKKAYLRVFHGATATVPLVLRSGSRQEATAKYAQATDFLPFEPGKRDVEICPEGTSVPMLTRTLDLQAGTTTYLFLSRDELGRGEIGTLVFTDSSNVPSR